MSVFAVVGGTGTLGRHVADALREQAAEVRVLARRSGEYRVDLVDGSGLDAALAGVDVVIDTSNGSPRRPEPVLVDGARRLVQAAARAGVSHVLCVSIVGIEQVPTGYYRAKLAQEEIVREGPVPWSIVRSTQFHELVAAGLQWLGRWRISPRSNAALQPIAAAEAGRAVAEAAGRPPSPASVTIAGPEVQTLSMLARVWAERQDRRLLALGLPLPPRIGAPLQAGALSYPDPEFRGETTFASWLSGRSPIAG